MSAVDLNEIGALAADIAADLAGELRAWLACGPIQGESGAFHAWYDRDTAALSFEYPEITGYALTYLAWLEEATDRELENGRRAGGWLLDRIESGNLAARDGWDRDAVYLFDLGMIASGLMTFGARVGSRDFIAAGQSLALDLHDQISVDGELESISPVGPAGGGRSGWSVDGSVHLLKLVQPLLLADASGVATVDRRVEAFVAAIKDLQSPEGWFPTQVDGRYVMLHPHHYAIEGLFVWGRARGDRDALDRARLASEWAWRHQLETGGLPRAVIFDEAIADIAALRVEQWDVTAQAIRAAVATGSSSDGTYAAIERLARAASRPAGGGSAALLYQPGEAPHENAWATLFGAQALAAAAGSPLSWKTLV